MAHQPDPAEMARLARERLRARKAMGSIYVQCVRSLLCEPTTDFAGRFYTLTGARNEPKGP